MGPRGPRGPMGPRVPSCQGGTHGLKGPGETRGPKEPKGGHGPQGPKGGPMSPRGPGGPMGPRDPGFQGGAHGPKGPGGDLCAQGPMGHGHHIISDATHRISHLATNLNYLPHICNSFSKLRTIAYNYVPGFLLFTIFTMRAMRSTSCDRHIFQRLSVQAIDINGARGCHCPLLTSASETHPQLNDFIWLGRCWN